MLMSPYSPAIEARGSQQNPQALGQRLDQGIPFQPVFNRTYNYQMTGTFGVDGAVRPVNLQSRK